ncbi:MAG: alkaline phosphatase family protein, partial [Nitrososphaerales archaeon]
MRRRAVKNPLTSTYRSLSLAVALMFLAVALEGGLPPASRAISPIQHIIIVMQENRTFDNFFWTYPGQIGYKANLCMPYYSQLVSGCLKPVKATSYVMQDIPHNSVATLTALDNGKMDGFLKAARLGNPSYPFNMLQARAVMSYYGNSTLPYYWAYAKHYVLADQYFSSAKSQSQPNHWYMIAGKAPPISLTKSAEQERAACYNPTTQKFTMSTCTY